MDFSKRLMAPSALRSPIEVRALSALWSMQSILAPTRCSSFASPSEGRKPRALRDVDEGVVDLGRGRRRSSASPRSLRISFAQPGEGDPHPAPIPERDHRPSPPTRRRSSAPNSRTAVEERRHLVAGGGRQAEHGAGGTGVPIGLRSRPPSAAARRSRPRATAGSRPASAARWRGTPGAARPGPPAEDRHPAVAVARSRGARRPGSAPPTWIGGCGFCTGLGQANTGSKSTSLPWYSALSWVQICLHRLDPLAQQLEARSRSAVPWFSISSAFQPPPIPNRKRPFEMRSSDADLLRGLDRVALHDQADARRELERLRRRRRRRRAQTKGSITS